MYIIASYTKINIKKNALLLGMSMIAFLLLLSTEVPHFILMQLFILFILLFVNGVLYDG